MLNNGFPRQEEKTEAKGLHLWHSLGPFPGLWLASFWNHVVVFWVSYLFFVLSVSLFFFCWCKLAWEMSLCDFVVKFVFFACIRKRYFNLKRGRGRTAGAAEDHRKYSELLVPFMFCHCLDSVSGTLLLGSLVQILESGEAVVGRRCRHCYCRNQRLSLRFPFFRQTLFRKSEYRLHDR